MVEIEEMINDNYSIVCLTETQLKYNKIKINENCVMINKMRELQDRKGGGLMILYKKGSECDLKQINTKHNDVLHCKGIVCGLNIHILLVYLSSNDKERNKNIKAEIIKTLNSHEEENLILLGDFNGHIGFLGQQKQDDNGELVLELMEKYGLVLINDDPKCTGCYTWSRGDQRSVIDFVLVTKSMYNHYKCMEIDENQRIFDLSDHNLLKVHFRNYGHHKGNYTRDKWIKQEYYKTDSDSMKEYIRTLEERIRENNVTEISKLSEMMKEVADEKIKAVYKRKVGYTQDRIIEPPWINESIRRGIKLRKRINRQRRNEQQPEERERLWHIYKIQKKKVQVEIKEEIYKHEEKIVEEIKYGQNSKNMWKHINKLRQNKERNTEELCIYNEQGQMLTEAEKATEIINYWSTIYKKHENDINLIWNNEARIRYIDKFEEGDTGAGVYTMVERQEGQQDEERELEVIETEVECRENIIEHMEMAYRINRRIQKMDTPRITTKALKEHLQKMKNKKATGLDGLKPELYKAFANSKICLETLEKSLNAVLDKRETPENWKCSKTVMIPKEAKPTAKDLRPIALTEIIYKIFMATGIRKPIENHMYKNDQQKDEQSGFTDGGRIENNIFILKHCIESSYRRKKPLFVISIDYRKAFDSVKRGKIIEVMMRYNIHPMIIDIIANIYKGDRTVIQERNGNDINIDVTSGIKQGCTGSTTLFKLITYKILEDLEENGKGFEDKNFKLNALFFADDGLLLTNSYEDAQHNIDLLIRSSKECGLDINKDKCKIIIFNMKNKPEKIREINVTTEIKYLGVTITHKRDCFKKYREERIEKAKRMANLTYPIIAQSCNKILIGKTYWKSVVLPSILYASSIMNYTNTEIEQLQRIDNGVYRQLLSAPKYAQIPALRGEVGATSMTARIMQGHLQYLKNSMKEEGNGIVREIIQVIREEKTDCWILKANTYLQKLDLNYTRLKNITNKELKDRIRQWDSDLWRREMNERSSMEIYREWKKEIKGEERLYDNRPESSIFFKCRTNNMPLNDRKRFQNGDTKCEMCGARNEDLEHFLLICPEYEEERRNTRKLQRPYQEDTKEVIGDFLFGEDIEEAKETTYKFWRKREKKRKLTQRLDQ